MSYLDLFTEEWIEYFKQKGVADNIENELKRILPFLSHTKFYPEKENVFRAFKDLSPSQVKVVVLGMDPYPGTYTYEYNRYPQAIGRAFAVDVHSNIPASLCVITKSSQLESISKDLREWVDQGVLLLNTALTVEPSKAGSHIKLWETFTDLVLTSLDQEDITFLLFGKNAEKAASVIKTATKVVDVHPAATCYNPRLVFGTSFKQINSLTKIIL